MQYKNFDLKNRILNVINQENPNNNLLLDVIQYLEEDSQLFLKSISSKYLHKVNLTNSYIFDLAIVMRKENLRYLIFNYSDNKSILGKPGLYENKYLTISLKKSELKLKEININCFNNEDLEGIVESKSTNLESFNILKKILLNNTQINNQVNNTQNTLRNNLEDLDRPLASHLSEKELITPNTNIELLNLKNIKLLNNLVPSFHFWNSKLILKRIFKYVGSTCIKGFIYLDQSNNLTIFNNNEIYLYIEDVFNTKF